MASASDQELVGSPRLVGSTPDDLRHKRPPGAEDSGRFGRTPRLSGYPPLSGSAIRLFACSPCEASVQ